jgi:hypothetical protein
MEARPSKPSVRLLGAVSPQGRGWFEGIKVDEREVDGHVQVELMTTHRADGARQ